MQPAERPGGNHVTLRSTAAVLLATLVIAPSGAAAPLIDQIGGVAFGPASPR